MSVMGSRLRGRVAVALVALLLGACGGGEGAPAGDRQTPTGDEVVDGAVDPLSCPEKLAVDASGALLVPDICTNRVLRVSPAGVWSMFAGTGEAGYSGDGGPATAAELEYVAGLTVDEEGNVYIVECGGNVVRRVGPDGIITTVAGLGGKGAGKGDYSGDGGPATKAELNAPADGAIDPSGNLYIADRDNRVIRRVDRSGVITTFAGGGVAGAGPPPEGAPATDVRFGLPVSVVVDSAGNVYISDEPGHRVWKVDPSGTITTYAGTGKPGFSGDGGPADQARLNGPYDLAIDDEDNLFIVDYENRRIRRVDPNGVITTVAGNGEVGVAGDGGPATEAQIQSPYGLVVGGSGNLYIADQENALIRVVDPAGIIRTLEFQA